MKIETEAGESATHKDRELLDEEDRKKLFLGCAREKENECVCVCLCEREREREREREAGL